MNKFDKLIESTINELFDTKLKTKILTNNRKEVEVQVISENAVFAISIMYIKEGRWVLQKKGFEKGLYKSTKKGKISKFLDTLMFDDNWLDHIERVVYSDSELDAHSYNWEYGKANIADTVNIIKVVVDEFFNAMKTDAKDVTFEFSVPDIGRNNSLNKFIDQVIKHIKKISYDVKYTDNRIYIKQK